MEKKDFDGDMAELEDRHLSERNQLEAELESDEISMNRNLQESLNREKDEVLQQMHTDAIKDLSEKYGMDAQEQEEMLERYKRDAENFELVNSGKRNQQMTALKAKLAARRTKKLAGVERSCEERAQKRAD